jgi:hypothetical protein
VLFQVIGSQLATFDDFCPTAGAIPADREDAHYSFFLLYAKKCDVETNLQFTLPNSTTVGTRCQNPGDCVVQLFWATPDLSQNYYYCLFTHLLLFSDALNTQQASTLTWLLLLPLPKLSTPVLTRSAPGNHSKLEAPTFLESGWVLERTLFYSFT